MLQLNNTTPFAADISLFPNEQAIDTLYLIVKATFNIGSKWTLVDEQLPPQQEDIYWSEPENSSLKLASDYHTGKPATDIIMLGNACAPRGQKVPQMDVNLSVGHVSKSVRVIGDREWRNGRISAPKPFQVMPMVYEKAYGGVVSHEEVPIAAELRNLVGTGFAGKRNTSDMEAVALPNLEDPRQLITDINDQPEPACFAFSSPNWQPRLAFAGTYDEAWQKTRAPYLPKDYDSRFLNMAHREMVYPGFIQGGEPVQITGMHEAGSLQFVLPAINLIGAVTVSGQERKTGFNMETLIIEPNKMTLSMVWRASMLCDKKKLKISDVKIGLSGRA